MVEEASGIEKVSEDVKGVATEGASLVVALKYSVLCSNTKIK